MGFYKTQGALQIGSRYGALYSGAGRGGALYSGALYSGALYSGALYSEAGRCIPS